MCRILRISRSIVYYPRKNKREDIELETELFDYVNWYNNFRIHSSLNYLTPVEYKVVNGENV